MYDNVRNFRTRGFGLLKLATSPNFHFCFQGHNWFLPSIFCGISQGPLRTFPRPGGVTIKDRCFGYFRNLSWVLEQVPPGNLWKWSIPPAGYLQNVQLQKAFGISLFLEGQDFLYTWYLWIYNIQHTFQAPKGVGKFKNHCQKTTFNESKFSMLEKNPVKITSWDLSASTCKANPEGIPFWYLILVPSGGTNIFPLKLGPAWGSQQLEGQQGHQQRDEDFTCQRFGCETIPNGWKIFVPIWWGHHIWRRPIDHYKHFLSTKYTKQK